MTEFACGHRAVLVDIDGSASARPSPLHSHTHVRAHILPSTLLASSSKAATLRGTAASYNCRALPRSVRSISPRRRTRSRAAHEQARAVISKVVSFERSCEAVRGRLDSLFQALNPRASLLLGGVRDGVHFALGRLFQRRDRFPAILRVQHDSCERHSDAANPYHVVAGLVSLGRAAFGCRRGSTCAAWRRTRDSEQCAAEHLSRTAFVGRPASWPRANETEVHTAWCPKHARGAPDVLAAVGQPCARPAPCGATAAGAPATRSETPQERSAVIFGGAGVLRARFHTSATRRPGGVTFVSGFHSKLAVGCRS